MQTSSQSELVVGINAVCRGRALGEVGALWLLRRWLSCVKIRDGARGNCGRGLGLVVVVVGSQQRRLKKRCTVASVLQSMRRAGDNK